MTIAHTLKDSNIVGMMEAMATARPYHPAILFPQGRDAAGKVSYTHYTYRQLQQASDCIASGLQQIGIKRGMRTVLMVKPSLDFFALTFALLRAGIVPVMIDPGIGLAHLKQCIADAEPEAFIGIPAAHMARRLFKWGQSTLRILVHVGGSSWGQGVTLNQIKELGASQPIEYPLTHATETAAILFTSGSTGPPKGVVYQHGHFLEQVRSIQENYAIAPGEIDLPTFPLFALFDPALGMTTVVPDMDFTRPAQADPRKIIQAVEDFGITNMFCSPALLKRFSLYGEQHQISLPTLKRIISAGAPAQAEDIQRCLKMLPPEARIYTPYGATEALPVSSISSPDFLQTTTQTHQGLGICVGQPINFNDVAIIAISEEPVPQWEESLRLPAGQIGEIVVKGPTVTAEYFKKPQATQLAKIPSENGLWHRMGDVGYLDENGRLWYCGRKAHRVQLAGATLYTIPFERIFTQHPAVSRAALVGVPIKGQTAPVLCIELKKPASGTEAEIKQELLQIAARHPLTQGLQHILFHPSFPVDIRHNSKIFREKLAVWAQNQLW